jgi:hypothetical protein
MHRGNSVQCYFSPTRSSQVWASRRTTSITCDFFTVNCYPFKCLYVSIFRLLSKKKKKGKWCLWDHQSVCVPLITFEPIGRFVWNSVGRSCHWSWPRLYNPVPSTIPKWRTFKLLRWMKNLHQSTWDHENTNMTAVWMLKFIVCFVETTHEPLQLDKWTLV